MEIGFNVSQEPKRVRLDTRLLEALNICSFVYYTYVYQSITKTRLFKDIENFTFKNWKFSDKKKTLIFFVFLLKTYIVGTR